MTTRQPTDDELRKRFEYNPGLFWDEAPEHLRAEQLLVATGRRPVTRSRTSPARSRIAASSASLIPAMGSCR